MWGLGATIVCATFAIVMSPVGALIANIDEGRAANRLGIFGARFILRTTATRVRLTGLHHLQPGTQYVFVANHQSVMDIIALAASLPYQLRFVAKLQVSRIPFFGFAVRRSRHILINLENGRAIRRALVAGRLGFSIVVFPEGHRFVDGAVHRFRPGAAWLAIRAGLPCVPIAVNGGGDILPPRARIGHPGRSMTISIGSPIEPDELARMGRRALTERLEHDVRRLFAGSSPASP